MNAGKWIDRGSARPGNKPQFRDLILQASYGWPITEVILSTAAGRNTIYSIRTLLDLAIEERYFEVMK